MEWLVGYLVWRNKCGPPSCRACYETILMKIFTRSQRASKTAFGYFKWLLKLRRKWVTVFMLLCYCYCVYVQLLLSLCTKAWLRPMCSCYCYCLYAWKLDCALCAAVTVTVFMHESLIAPYVQLLLSLCTKARLRPMCSCYCYCIYARKLDCALCAAVTVTVFMHES